MRNTYIQVEILLCLLDCQRHTLLEIQNKIGCGKETIRRHVQDLSILLPIEIYRSGKQGQQGGGGIRLQKNFLLKILFEKGEIEIIALLPILILPFRDSTIYGYRLHFINDKNDIEYHYLKEFMTRNNLK